MLLQFGYSEICHYLSIFAWDVSFCTYLILLDPSLIPLQYEKTKLPLRILSAILLSLFYHWHMGSPHVSVIFNPSPSPLISLPLLSNLNRPIKGAPRETPPKSIKSLVDSGPLVRHFSPGWVLEPGLKGFHRRDLNCPRTPLTFSPGW
jgi:hypothetical protein